MEQKSPANEILYAFYDLAVSPVTFDIFNFLLVAEMERKERGYIGFKVFFVPAEGDGFLGGFSYDNDVKRWRFQNILIPACFMMPTCQSFEILHSRADAREVESRAGSDVFPESYKVNVPVDCYSASELVAKLACGFAMPSVRSSNAARRYSKEWCGSNTGGKPLVTITLRQATHGSIKNSNIIAWANFANKLLAEGEYYPIIIPDTEAVFQPIAKELKELPYLPEAATNLDFRGGIYENAYLNLMTGNGPYELCKNNPLVRFLMFKILEPGWHDTTRESILGNFGIKIGEQMHYLTHHQKFVWEDDTFDIICREFEEMTQVITETEEREPELRGNMDNPLDVALRLDGNDRCRQAKEIYSYLLKKTPENLKLKELYRNPESSYKIGVFESRRKNYSAAILWLEDAVGKDPRKSKYFSALAMAQSATGAHNEAIVSANLALKQNSDNVEASLVQAISYDSIGNYELGVLVCEALIERKQELVPGYEILAYETLGELYRKQGRNAEAIEMLFVAQRIRNLN